MYKIKIQKFNNSLNDEIYEKISSLDIIYHMIQVNKSNLRYPIIIDNKYTIYDGRHRLMKAIIKNKKYINAYILDKKILKKFSSKI